MAAWKARNRSYHNTSAPCDTPWYSKVTFYLYCRPLVNAFPIDAILLLLAKPTAAARANASCIVSTQGDRANLDFCQYSTCEKEQTRIHTRIESHSYELCFSWQGPVEFGCFSVNSFRRSKTRRRQRDHSRSFKVHMLLTRVPILDRE